MVSLCLHKSGNRIVKSHCQTDKQSTGVTDLTFLFSVRDSNMYFSWEVEMKLTARILMKILHKIHIFQNFLSVSGKNFDGGIYTRE